MIDEQRLSRYLHDRARTVELRPSTPAAAVRRAGRRRRTRRATAVALATATLGTSTMLVTRGGGSPAEVTTGAPVVTPSPLEWALVEPSIGLSGFRGGATTAIADDGTVYALSTAPGPAPSDPGAPAPLTLYRSTDGAEWSPVEMPADFWASALTGSGGRLYAVGTAPAGGDATRYALATSADGGATWTTAPVSPDTAALTARYPGEVVVGDPTVAVHDGTVVVSTWLGAHLDVESRLPAGVATTSGGWWSPNAGYETTGEGVILLTGECLGGGAGAVECQPADEHGDPAGPGAAHVYTWADLGVDGDLRSLVGHGRHELVVAPAGGDFVAVPSPGARSSARPALVAADDGFWLFLTSFDGREPFDGTAEVLRSVDGVSWEPAGTLPGLVGNAGVIGGRPAAAVVDGEGRSTVHLAQPDGGWLAVDPADAVEGEAEADIVVFGPLGWAATVWVDDAPTSVDEQGAAVPEERVPVAQVVHSLDGTSMSLVPVDDLVDPPDRPDHLEPVVTADAVIVRFRHPGSDEPGTPSRQRAVVGTPRA